MLLNGLLISHNDTAGMSKIIKKVKSLGEKYYIFRKLYPVYKITLNDKTYIYMHTEDKNINMLNVLGFGFEGLYDDNDRIKEIEDFGKYRCIIDIIDEDVPDDQVIVENII